MGPSTMAHCPARRAIRPVRYAQNLRHAHYPQKSTISIVYDRVVKASVVSRAMIVSLNPYSKCKFRLNASKSVTETFRRNRQALSTRHPRTLLLLCRALGALIATIPIVADPCIRITYIGPENTVVTGRSIDWMLPLHTKSVGFPARNQAGRSRRC